MTRPLKIFLLAAAAVVVVACLYFATRPSRITTQPTVVLMDRNYKIPAQKVSWLYRIVPVTWGWFWKFKEMVTGKRKTIYIDAAIMDLGGWNESWATDLSLPQAAFTGTNGLRIWILDGSKLIFARNELITKEHAEFISLGRIITTDGGQAAMSCGNVGRLKPTIGQNELMTKEHAELLSLGRIITTDGGQAAMRSGNLARINQVQTEVSFSMEFLPRIGRDMTDLITRLTVSEWATNQSDGNLQALSISVRTNLALAARIRIPNNCGIFLLDATPADPGATRIGILLSTKIQANAFGRRLQAVVAGKTPAPKK